MTEEQYVKHDWSKGEVITETLMDNIETGITEALNQGKDIKESVVSGDDWSDSSKNNTDTNIASTAFVRAGINSLNLQEVTWGATKTIGTISETNGIISIQSQDIATTSKDGLGLVRIGDNINVNNGIISPAIASSNNPGIVQIGNNINVNNGTISVATASGATLGVVQIGDNISIDNGSISVIPASKNDLGVVKIGNNIDVNNQGTISITTDGTYDTTDNKIATQSTVSTAISTAIQDLDVNATTFTNLETIDTISETNGKINITKQSIPLATAPTVENGETVLNSGNDGLMSKNDKYDLTRVYNAVFPFAFIQEEGESDDGRTRFLISTMTDDENPERITAWADGITVGDTTDNIFIGYDEQANTNIIRIGNTSINETQLIDLLALLNT